MIVQPGFIAQHIPTQLIAQTTPGHSNQQTMSQNAHFVRAAIFVTPQCPADPAVLDIIAQTRARNSFVLLVIIAPLRLRFAPIVSQEPTHSLANPCVPYVPPFPPPETVRHRKARALVTVDIIQTLPMTASCARLAHSVATASRSHAQLVT